MDPYLETYTDRGTVLGDPGSTYVWICDESEWLAFRNSSLYSLDPRDPSLMCVNANTVFNGDPNGHQMRVTLEYASIVKARAFSVNAPFQIRGETAFESVTVGDPSKSVFKLSDGTMVPPGVAITLPVSISRAVLFGLRSSANLSTFEPYNNTVNADTFLGAAPGTVRFVSYSYSPAQDGLGNPCYSVEIVVERNTKGWNTMNKPGTNQFLPATYVKDGNPPFLAVAYAPLLA